MRKYEPPYTIGINDELVDEFFCQFEDAINEQLFVLMTEEEGSRKRTLIEACEHIVCAVKGVTYEQYVDEDLPENVSHDDINMESKDYCIEMNRALLKRIAEAY